MNKATMMALAAAQMEQGLYHMPFVLNESPIFYPKKHTKESYRSQQRAAKKRRNNKQK